MSLLREIQEALLRPGSEIGPILLKLRLLASRLGSEALEDWIRYEAEGYPLDAEVPEYRKIGVSYTATFFGPFGSGIRDAPIPPYLIEKLAGERWTQYECRQSVAAIDSLVSADNGSGSFNIEASNLILLLQGKVYKDYSCNSVIGNISRAALVALQNAVRTKVIELTIRLEKSMPTSADITVGAPIASKDAAKQETVTKITNQVVYGGITHISNSITGDQATLQITVGDRASVARTLSKAGIAEEDAKEFADLIASEEGENKGQPFGPGTKAWIVKNIGKALDGTWKMGVDVATKVLTEAALKFSGL